MLQAEDVGLDLGGRPVLKGISFSAPAGTLTAIVGPNGSGKTSLLRTLTGELPCRGAIRLNGREVARLSPPEAAAMRAVLPQAASMAFPFTALEVVTLGLHAGASGARQGVAAAALRRVGLGDRAGAFVHELSGGQQQRVHLARVLAQVWEPVTDAGPRWLFLDEPVSSLDIAHQLEVMGIARDYADAGGGVVAVMHDLNLTAMFADRVLLLADGRIEAAGPPGQALSDAALGKAYGCGIRINRAPPPNQVFVLPQSVDGGAPARADGPLSRRA